MSPKHNSIHIVFENYLKKRDLKYTLQRKSVVTELFKLYDHVEAELFMSKMSNMGYKISRGTLYSTLKLLTESNLVQKIKTSDNKVYYEPTYGRKHHDHVICQNCGKIFEFADEIIEERQKKIADELGFKIEDHDHILHASCHRNDCENKQ